MAGVPASLSPQRFSAVSVAPFFAVTCSLTPSDDSGGTFLIRAIACHWVPLCLNLGRYRAVSLMSDLLIYPCPLALPIPPFPRSLPPFTHLDGGTLKILIPFRTPKSRLGIGGSVRLQLVSTSHPERAGSGLRLRLARARAPFPQQFRFANHPCRRRPYAWPRSRP